MVSEAEHTSGLEKNESVAGEQIELPEDARTQANLAASANGRNAEVDDLELLWMESNLPDANEVTVMPPMQESGTQADPAKAEVQSKGEGQSKIAKRAVEQTVQAEPVPKKQEDQAAETAHVQKKEPPKSPEKPVTTAVSAKEKVEVEGEATVAAVKKQELEVPVAKDDEGADDKEPGPEERPEEPEQSKERPVYPPTNGHGPTAEAGGEGGGEEPPENKLPTGGDSDGEGGDHDGDGGNEESSPEGSEEPQQPPKSGEGVESLETERAEVSSYDIEKRPRRDISELSAEDQALLEEIQQSHGIPGDQYGQPTIDLTTDPADARIRYNLQENPETHFKSVYVTGHDVAERLRGFGLGRRLLRELARECILNGVDEITALAANEAAVRTWLSVFGGRAVEFCDAQATTVNHDAWKGKKDVLPMTPQQALDSARERGASLHVRVDRHLFMEDYPNNKKEYDAILRPFKLDE